MKKMILLVVGLGLAVILLSACGGTSSTPTPTPTTKSDLEEFQAAGTLYTVDQLESVLAEGNLGTNVSNALIPLAFNESGSIVKPTEPTEEQTGEDKENPPFTPYFMSKETYKAGMQALEAEISSYDFIQLDSTTPAIVAEANDTIETDALSSATYIDVYGLETTPSDVSEISANRFWIVNLGYGNPYRVCGGAWYSGWAWYCPGWRYVSHSQICRSTYGSGAYSAWWNWWAKRPYCKKKRW